MENQVEYENARKKVQAKLGFRVHLLVFVLVMALLFVINILNSPENLWFVWPLLGWGIGVLVHALKVFVLPQKLIPTDEMVKKQVEKDTRRNQ